MDRNGGGEPAKALGAGPINLGTSRYRTLVPGPAHLLWQALLWLIPLAGIAYILRLHMLFGYPLYRAQYVGVFLALILAATYLGVPAGAAAPRNRVPWYDGIGAAASLVVGLYITVRYPDIAPRLGLIETERLILGILAIFLVLEALRRLIGWALVLIVLVFLGYAFVAPYLPGPLFGSPTTLYNLVNYLYLDSNSMLMMASIGGTLALAFVLFGQVLLAFGGGKMLNDLAVGLLGNVRGGAAKGAVIGSSLMGTLTGGPMTNVLLTGTVTIPLMIRTGFRPHFAGAIEAVASSGGQIMPPVMGIAAFLIADFLGIPYAEVALAALIPAILYYLCLFFQVDFAAARDGMRGLPASESLPAGTAVRNSGPLFLALFILVYTLFILRYEPSTAGVMSAGLAVPALLLAKANRGNLRARLSAALTGTSKLLIEVGVILTAAGFIVGVTSITGLGFNLAMALARLGSSSLALLLVASAVVCLLLGMGLPSVAAYALVAILVGPAIVELGVEPLAAHLFIFYFAIVSNFTPPVALACFAAAPIAQASPYQIGFTAVRFGLLAFIVPFLFVYSPTLILVGEPWEIAVSVVTAVFGTALLAAALTGYFLRPLTPLRRGVFALAGAALLIPVHQWPAGGFVAALVSVLLGLAVVGAEWLRRPRG